MRAKDCDILVIGSGIAGLSFALHSAANFPDKKILVVCKGGAGDSNTRHAQGGIAAVMDMLRDSYQNHIDDTLIAGDGHCNSEVVEMVVREAPEQIAQLIRWGVEFDGGPSALDLAREGGHSHSRVLHCKDHTGKSVADALLHQARQTGNIEILENTYVSELLQNASGQCVGAMVNCQMEQILIQSDYTMLASGGAGQVYSHTSNPGSATGDGVALAIKAGARLQDMAFVQFHPTILIDKCDNSFLISEAVRGFGGILRNWKEEDFMHKYDSRGSLATRDVVSRAIHSELEGSPEPYIFLDVRHIDSKRFAHEFPTINEHLQACGISPEKDLIPIAPAAHYFCGGVATDTFGKTSVERLFASGECACTGLHGANRLASNSLLEALVFAHRAAQYLQANYQNSTDNVAVMPKSKFQTCTENCMDVKLSLQRLMMQNVGVVRTKQGLLEAMHMIETWKESVLCHSCDLQHCEETRNLLFVASAVVEDSLKQTENRGAFYRLDLCPETQSA